jgi:hypothetical protein
MALAVDECARLADHQLHKRLGTQKTLIACRVLLDRRATSTETDTASLSTSETGPAVRDDED